MMNRRTFIFLLFCISYQFNFAQNSDYEIDKRIDSVLNKLSLAEKIAYFSNIKGNVIPAFPALNLPSLRIVNEEVQANLQQELPSTLGIAATWDEKLAMQLGQHTAAIYRNQNYQFIPVWGANLYRSPLQMSNLFTFGEDPKLAANLLSAYTQGTQKQKVVANLQGFGFGGNIKMGERTLQELYLFPYQQAMTTKNAWAVSLQAGNFNGKNSCEQDSLLKNVLRNTMGFKGIVFSPMNYNLEHFAESFKAGIEVETGNQNSFSAANLTSLMEKDESLKRLLDEKLKHIWSVGLKMGWHKTDAPDFPATSKDSIFRAATLGSFVMLKNPNNLLPLDANKAKSLTILELNGNDFENLPTQNGLNIEYLSTRPKATENLVQPTFFIDSLLKETGVIASFYDNTQGKDTPLFIQTNEKLELKRNIRFRQDSFSVKWTAFYDVKNAGNFTFQVKNNGQFRLFIDNKLVRNQWKNSEIKVHNAEVSLAKGVHKIELLYYTSSKNIEEVQFGIAETPVQQYLKNVAQFKNTDAVVICIGDKFSENKNTRNFDITTEELTLISEITKVNKNVIVVANAAGSLSVDKLPYHVALFYTAHPSAKYASAALCDLLWGKENPSGRLPFSIEKRSEDHAIAMADKKRTGETLCEEGVFIGYRNFDKKADNSVLYPFGYGLSYSSFLYSNLQISPSHYEGNGEIALTFDVTNTSSKAGFEVVQVYLNDRQSRILRPEKELKAFQKVYLKAGETQHLRISLTDKDLQFYNPNKHQWEKEKGLFEVRIGSSSQDANLREIFSFGKRKAWGW
ncbi:MAG: glycoside hydrolase family 3 C-terminal domain-containing protein [Bacteroidia bacterium]